MLAYFHFLLMQWKKYIGEYESRQNGGNAVRGLDCDVTRWLKEEKSGGGTQLFCKKKEIRSHYINLF